MGLALFVIFVVVPFVDLVLLLRIGGIFGFWPTVAFTLGMGALGAWLAKREGLRVWRAWRQALAELRPPEQGIIDGVLVIAGGALLAAPGVITDVVGLTFLVPVTRRLVAGLVRRAVDRKIQRGQLHVVTSSSFVPFDVDAGGSSSARGPDLVETSGEAVGEPEEPPKRLEK